MERSARLRVQPCPEHRLCQRLRYAVRMIGGTRSLYANCIRSDEGDNVYQAEQVPAKRSTTGDPDKLLYYLHMAPQLA